MVDGLSSGEGANLDGKEITSGSFSAEIHTTKSSPADGLQDLKVIDGHAADVVAAGTGSRCGRACRSVVVT